MENSSEQSSGQTQSKSNAGDVYDTQVRYNSEGHWHRVTLPEKEFLDLLHYGVIESRQVTEVCLTHYDDGTRLVYTPLSNSWKLI